MSDTNTPQKINIDFSKYADNQLRANIESAINFPSTVSFNMVTMPIIFTVVAFVGALLLVWKFSIVMGILLGLAAFTTVPIMAYSFGLSATINQLVDDGEALFGSALGLLDNIAADLPNLGDVDYKITPIQIFKAAINAVIMPIVTDKVAGKIPIFGGALAGRLRKMLESMIGAVDIPAVGTHPNQTLFCPPI